jgi:hypothetical protein
VLRNRGAHLGDAGVEIPRLGGPETGPEAKLVVVRRQL